MYGNINPTKQQIERENRAKKKKSIIEKDVSSDRNINLLKDKLKNIVDKEERRKKMVKNLSEFFGKPPSGGKRKTRRKKRRKTRKNKRSKKRRVRKRKTRKRRKKRR